MTLANEARGVLVGGFIVEDGDEVLSITASGQVVRSPIDEAFRPTGRSTQGVKFVTPKKGDTVAVVARSVEASEDDDDAGEALDGEGATIDDQTASETETIPDPEDE
jgi:DNA gyrase subunit A